MPEPIGIFSHRLEDERERVKRLQIEQPISPLSPVTTISKEKAFILADSIQPSSATKAPQFRPVLPRPEHATFQSRSHPLLRIIRCLIKADEQTSLFLDVLEKEIDQTQMRLDELSDELKVALAEEMETKIWEGNWHTLETVIQYLSAASSIVLGGALVLTDADQGAGSCLIAAGGLGLFNQIMTDTKGWSLLVDYFTESQEMQKTLEGRIQTTMFLLSTALALSGAALAFDSGVLQEAAQAEQIFKIISVATALLGAGNKLAAGATTQRASAVKKKILSLNGESTYLKEHLEAISLQGKESQQKIHDMVLVVQNAIKQMSTT